MRKHLEETAIDAFAREVRVFAAWARGDGGESMDVRSALLRILALYQQGLLLPMPWTEGMDSDLAECEVPQQELHAVIQRAWQLPCQFYAQVVDPFEDPQPTLSGSHIADDIGDIYRDVVGGLMLFDRGMRDEALWEWKFNLQIHWGDHATGAIRALHLYLAQENPDGLASSA